jgi:hypothetical protein
MHTLTKTAVAALCAASLVGCTDSPTGPETVNVTGTVSYQGNPVAGANVLFQPIDGSSDTLASQSLTDETGRFELSTHVGGGKFKPGIVPDKYAVTITKLDTASISTTLAPPKNLLPKKYGNAKTSGLSADVAAGKENDFEFALTED